MPAATFTLPVEITADGIRVAFPWAFDPQATLDCGQAFRWEKLPDGRFQGIAGDRICELLQEPTGILLKDVTRTDFDGFWRSYFDLDRDYSAIRQILSAEPTLAKAVSHAPGIHVLRQDPWETLCTFIISQNNHIPRIKGIVQRLCDTYGVPVGQGQSSFPTPQALASLNAEALAPIRAGFRARYLIDAAQRVVSGDVDLSALAYLPLEEARASLRKIVGVGEKVAECTLLFGCGRMECFPMDVWMKRVMACLFPQGLPGFAKPYAGIAQQYLFHYARTGAIRERLVSETGRQAKTVTGTKAAHRHNRPENLK